jgi:hypothetical protein
MGLRAEGGAHGEGGAQAGGRVAYDGKADDVGGAARGPLHDGGELAGRVADPEGLAAAVGAQAGEVAAAVELHLPAVGAEDEEASAAEGRGAPLAIGGGPADGPRDEGHGASAGQEDLAGIRLGVEDAGAQQRDPPRGGAEGAGGDDAAAEEAQAHGQGEAAAEVDLGDLGPV